MSEPAKIPGASGLADKVINTLGGTEVWYRVTRRFSRWRWSINLRNELKWRARR